MVEQDTEQKLYARAHSKILELVPMLKGETLTRDHWYKLCNINSNNPDHIPFKNAINKVLWNLTERNKKKQLIVKNGSGFKIVDDTLIPIDFVNPTGARVDLKFPFDIHKYGFLYRKNIMIVYGSKDAGKTAFLFNVIRLNMHKHRISYFSSEMVGEEMKIRLSKADDLKLEDWRFEAYERSSDFDQVISPDDINIIDFLELGGEVEYFHGVGLIRKIYDKLDKGVAIIACQKNKDAELPKGGEGMLEKARIAVSLDPNRATLKVCKNWADGVIMSPRDKSWGYQLVGGINIIHIHEQ